MTRWLVTRRGPNGEAYPTDLTAWLGYPEYDQQITVLRQRCAANPGWSLDSADADREHRRTIIGRRRYSAAINRFNRSAIGRTDPLHPDRVYEHPGSLEEWMPA